MPNLDDIDLTRVSNLIAAGVGLFLFLLAVTMMVTVIVTCSKHQGHMKRTEKTLNTIASRLNH